MTESSLPTTAAYRVALVDDHGVARAGFAALMLPVPEIEIVASGAVVAAVSPVILTLDLVVLDLHLSDGSEAGDNVRRIVGAGVNVLILTGADDPSLLRSAARAGALGMVRKSISDNALVEAVLVAAGGGTVASTEWAAALDSDDSLADAGLSPRERQVLALYASGEKAQAVAYLTDLSKDTVADYISRIRMKYARVGRPATTKIDLHRRANEDGLIAPAEQP